MSGSTTGASDPDSTTDAPPRFILLTECLQNDMFLNPGCRLCLPERVALDMLLGNQRRRHFELDHGRRVPPAEQLQKGPLHTLLEATIGRRRREEDGKGLLHVINIRDWHIPGPAYDSERRYYGPHCEKETWGAAYLDGLGQYLDPGGSALDEEASHFAEGRARIYHVHSDSVFDFRPREERRAGGGRYTSSRLEDLLDVLVQGSEKDVDRLSAELRRPRKERDPHAVATSLEGAGQPGTLYVAVIGVYTDVKVLTLLGGLMTRYEIPNLIVSDTFTASKTIDRQLAGLDAAAKVFGVEVMHGIGDLVRFLGGTPSDTDEDEFVVGDPFSRYQSYFQDKQNLLAYQEERLHAFLDLTEDRSKRVYERIQRANAFLIRIGEAFLVTSLVCAILSFAWPSRFDWKLSLVTGGLGLAGLVAVFFSKPMMDLQKNLTNLAVFHMVLERYSLKTAFARFHLTTPLALREVRSTAEAQEAGRQVEVLASQLATIERIDQNDYAALSGLGFGADSSAGKGTPIPPPPPEEPGGAAETDGAAPVEEEPARSAV